MNHSPANDELRDFHRFLSEKVSNGGAALSPEEALDEWRSHHPLAETDDDDLEAIQEALDDIANGDTGVPLEEFDREFRARHGLPPAKP